MTKPTTLKAALSRTAISAGCFAAAAGVTVLGLQTAVAQGVLPGSLSMHDSVATEQAAAPSAREVRLAAKVARLEGRFGCSKDGLGAGVIPSHTVVREGNTVHLATFDEGWAMYEGSAKGTLLSVCTR